MIENAIIPVLESSGADGWVATGQGGIFIKMKCSPMGLDSEPFQCIGNFEMIALNFLIPLSIYRISGKSEILNNCLKISNAHC